MEIKLPFGLRNRNIIHISEVQESERGLNCKCICPQCGIPLIAKLGPKNTHHFAHQNEDCKYALESALHLYAKQILESARKIRLPEVEYNHFGYSGILFQDRDFYFDNVIVEKRLGQIIPDLILEKQGIKLLVEITVTHGIDDEKLARIEEMKISTLEIDLGAFWGLIEFDRQNIANLILTETEHKYWIYNTKIEEKKRQIQIEVEQKRIQEENLRIEQEEAKRRLEEKSEMRRQQKIKLIPKLMSKEFQRAQKEMWAKNLSEDINWKRTSSYLKIHMDEVPAYLNIEIEGEFVFACDRRLWQATLFSKYIYKRLSKTSSSKIGVRHIVKWLKTKPYPLPLNWDLVYLKDVPEYKDAPGLPDVVCNFFINLSYFGFIEPDHYHDPGDSYYWWFRRIRDDLIFQPENYNGDQYIRVYDKLINKTTGEIIGDLKDIYSPRK